MTVVTGVASGSSNDIVVPDLSTLATATISSESATGFVLTGGDLSFTFSGTGFTYSGGAPSGGTITGVGIVSSSNPYLTSQTWSDLSVSAAAFWAAVTTSNLAAFDNLFFGGNDTFVSNNATGRDYFAAYGGSGTFNMQASTSNQGATLEGGSGNNTFNFAGNLNNNDYLIGGSGTNTVNLDGNTDASLLIASNIQFINMAAGYDYFLDLEDADIDPAGQTLTINGSSLGASDYMTISIESVALAGNLVFVGGAGTDTLDEGTGTGNVTFEGGSGSSNEVLYPDAYADYTVTYNPDGSVTVSKPGGGTDTITHAVYLDFANGYTVPTNPNVPWITGITSSPASGAALGVGETVTFTVDVSEVVTAELSGGVPTLSLNDGESASYTSGSGTNTLTFTYTVKAGDNTSDLQVTGLVMQSNGFIESGGVNLYGINAHEDTGIAIDTITPEASQATWSPMGPAPGVLGIGAVITVTLDMNEAVTVNTVGGLPTLTLNDGGIATYAGGSGTDQLEFSYTVKPGDLTSDLQITGAVIPAGSSIADIAGNAAVISDDPTYWYRYGNSSLFIDGTGPTDFTGNGLSDLLWQAADGTVAVWTMNGATPTGGGIVGNPGAGWHVVGSADFSFNGVSDLVWQNNDGTVAIWQMNGATSTGGAIVGSNPGPTWHVVWAGDFGGTTWGDILFQNDNGSVALWEMNGTTFEGGGVIGNPGPTWHVVGVGDFYDSGRDDILWQANDGTVAIWEVSGITQYGGGIVGNPGPGWHVVGTGDFNGDGYADILWQNTNGTVAIWEMDGTTIVGGGIVGNPGAGWQVAGVGDYNGDGYSDILWRNTNGTAAIWEMNGTSVIGGGVVGNPGTEWTLQGDGGAPYTIGSGFTVSLAVDATPPPATGAASVSTSESLTTFTLHPGIFAPAMPAHMGLAR